MPLGSGNPEEALCIELYQQVILISTLDLDAFQQDNFSERRSNRKRPETELVQRLPKRQAIALPNRFPILSLNFCLHSVRRLTN